MFSSASGSFGFKVTLGKGFGPPKGLLFTVEPGGTETRVWEAGLVNMPARALVVDDGRAVVTIDAVCRAGFEHALVVYGERGKVLSDYRLEDLLTREEIRAHVSRSMSSRWWTEDATFTFDHQLRHVLVTLSWGKAIRVDWTTGAIVDAR